jgi:hypothetical protein
MSKELKQYLPDDIINHCLVPYTLPSVEECKVHYENAMQLLQCTFLYTSDNFDREEFWCSGHRRTLMKCLRHQKYCDRVLQYLETGCVDDYFGQNMSIIMNLIQFRRVMSQLHRYFRSPIDIIDCDW